MISYLFFSSQTLKLEIMDFSFINVCHSKLQHQVEEMVKRKIFILL